MRGAILGGAAAGLMALSAPASAASFGIQSAYTDLDLGECTIVKSNDLETRRACPGYKGIPVMVSERTRRAYLSFGLSSTTEKAARQTLPVASTPGPTIEWRLSNRGGRWTPFATIVRYAVEAKPGKPPGEVLVVTRLGEGTTCRIAVVDALANADAEVLAQQAADAHGLDFDCDTAEPATIGSLAAW